VTLPGEVLPSVVARMSRKRHGGAVHDGMPL